MQELARDVMMVLGAALMLLAGLGMVRLPDLYLMMSASTKAATLGVALMMVAILLDFDRLGTGARAVGIIIFILLTAPVSAHMIGRAAYLTGVRLWSETTIDELEGRYDERTRTLVSKPPTPPRVD